MIDRLDTSYWPPQPIEQPPIRASQHLDAERLTSDMLYIDDDDRRRSVHATNEWADIYEFWAASCTEPKRFIDNSGKVANRMHLQGASYAFHQVAYQLAYMDGVADEWNTDLTRVINDAYIAPHDDRTRAERFLYHHVLAAHDGRFDRRKLLISRGAIDAVHNGEIVVEGAGKDSSLIIAKVALRWESLESEAALLFDRQ